RATHRSMKKRMTDGTARQPAQPAVPFVGVDVGIVPTLAVIPKHQEVALGGVVPDTPADEVGEDLRIPGVGLAQRCRGIIANLASLALVVPFGCVARRAVELGDDVPSFGGPGLLHFYQLLHFFGKLWISSAAALAFSEMSGSGSASARSLRNFTSADKWRDPSFSIASSRTCLLRSLASSQRRRASSGSSGAAASQPSSAALRK